MDTTLEQRRSDEKQIKELLQGYRPDDGPATGRLLGMLWPRINAFAASHKGARHGWTRELFLSGMVERLPRILAGFRERGCLFSTWFFSVMRKEWSRAAERERRIPTDFKACHELFPDRPEIRQAEDSPLADLDALDLRLLAVRHPELMTESPAREMEALGLLDPVRARRLDARLEELCRESGIRAGRKQERLDVLHARTLRFGQGRHDTVPGRLAVLARLVDRTARALRREFATMSYAEMARHLGCPPGSVAARMYRMRKKIRRACARCHRRASWRVS